MAGPNTEPYYSPVSKPHGAGGAGAGFSWRRTNFFSLAIITFLCSISYLFGVWQHGGVGSNGGGGGGSGAVSTISSTITANLGSNLPCVISSNTSSAVTKKHSVVKDFSRREKIDFTSHHSASDADDNGGVGASGDDDGGGKVKKYPACDVKYSEYTPCEDQRRSLKFPRDRLIYRERHCPEKKELLKCRIPAPYGYKSPFKWPDSRDLAWYANVPHKELAVEKAVQNWIRYDGKRLRFPGGGTMFPNGADAYIDDIDALINLKDGHIRTAIDTGCGVASWGAYLLSRNIITMSFAPRDTHVSQVQFALERGVPALIGVIASKRLPYPSRAFDMAHCSRCLIPWGQYDGVFLTEVDRVLRPGGYWILSGPPIRWRKYWKGWERTKEDLNEEQTGIENVAKSLCWKKLIEKDDIAIWQKPLNHKQCDKLKKVNKKPAFCPAQDPDKAWYTKIETCLTHLPEVSSSEEVAGGGLEKWPQRLNSIPPRIIAGTVNGVNSEVFEENSKLWKRRMSYYKTVNNQLGQAGRYRNLLDMNAYLGGFAASLVVDPVWVMNVVPVEAKVNTLGVIYERGLIGTYQSWCEAMSTYPRTYDLIHADSIFTLYKNKCEAEDILLEMDRILRPEGSVIIRDDVDTLIKVKRIAEGLEWDCQIVDHEDGPMEREKLLFAVKTYWTAPASSSSS